MVAGPNTEPEGENAGDMVGREAGTADEPERTHGAFAGGYWKRQAGARDE